MRPPPSSPDIGDIPSHRYITHTLLAHDEAHLHQLNALNARDLMSSENASASSITDNEKNLRGAKAGVSHPSAYDDEHATVRAGLEEVDQGLDGRPPWLLTSTEAKLLGIAGVGFFLDGASSPVTLAYHPI